MDSSGFRLRADPDRIVVAGDTHGDFGLLLLLLKDCAGVIDARGRWRPGDRTCVVLVGDTVDRHRPGVESGGEVPGEELFMHLYLNRLQREARRHGGRVLKLLGNHEEMNLRGNYNYASPLGRRLRKILPLRPGTAFARILHGAQDTHAFAQIGPYFFVHGGLGALEDDDLPLLASANAAVRSWFRGDKERSSSRRREHPAIATVSRMLWDRDFTAGEHCDAGRLQEIFDAVGRLGTGGRAPTMVFSGHTVTLHNGAPDSRAFTVVLEDDGDKDTVTLGASPMVAGRRRGMGINLSCDGRVARLDNGGSRAFGHDPSRGRLPQVLVINRDPHRRQGRDRMSVVRHRRGLLHQTRKCLHPSMDVAAIAGLLREELTKN